MLSFRKSIGFRLLGISVLLLVIPLVVDLVIFFEKRYKGVVAQAKGYLTEEVDSRTFPFFQIQEKNKKMLSLFDYFLGLSQHFPTQEDPARNEELKKLGLINNYYGMLLLKITEDQRAIVVASSLPNYLNRDLTHFFDSIHPFSMEAKEKGYVTTVVNDYKKSGFTPFLLTAKGVYSEEGKPVGIVAVVDSIGEQISFLLKVDEHPYPVNFALMQSSAIFFATSDPQLLYHYLYPLTSKEKELFLLDEPGAQGLLPAAALVVDAETQLPFIQFTWKRKTQLGYIQKLPGTDLSLLAYASYNSILRAPFNDFPIVYGSYLLVLIVGVTLSYFATRRMARPMLRLNWVMQKIQEGKLDTRYERDILGFEINRLGEIFNDLIDTLIEKQRIVEEERISKETYQSELRLGQQVQRSLLPRNVPLYAGVTLAEAFSPAIEVGGDFYDMFVKEDGKLVVLVADTSGKGVHACCYSLILKQMLRTMAQKEKNLIEAMRVANNLFCEDTAETGMFVTVFMAQYDATNGQFDFYSFGHNPPVLYRAETGTVEFLNHLDMVMGLLRREERKAALQSIQLRAGDVVVMYSDGVTEAHNKYLELFGEPRLLQLIQQEAHRSAEEIRTRVMEEVALFAKGAKQHDDITVLVMKVVAP